MKKGESIDDYPGEKRKTKFRKRTKTAKTTTTRGTTTTDSRKRADNTTFKTITTTGPASKITAGLEC